MECAARLAQDRGGIHLTVKELTSEVGVTPPAFYRHFASIEDLLEKVRLEGLDQLERSQDRAIQELASRDGDDSIEDVAGMLRAFIQFAMSHPGLYRIMTDSDVASRPSAEQKDRPAIAMIVDAIKSGQKEGQIVEGNPRDLAVAAWAAFHGLAALFTNGPLHTVLSERPQRAKQIEDALVTIVSRGLRKMPD